MDESSRRDLSALIDPRVTHENSARGHQHDQPASQDSIAKAAELTSATRVSILEIPLELCKWSPNL